MPLTPALRQPSPNYLEAAATPSGVAAFERHPGFEPPSPRVGRRPRPGGKKFRGWKPTSPAEARNNWQNPTDDLQGRYAERSQGTRSTRDIGDKPNKDGDGGSCGCTGIGCLVLAIVVIVAVVWGVVFWDNEPTGAEGFSCTEQYLIRNQLTQVSDYDSRRAARNGLTWGECRSYWDQLERR